MTNNPEKQNSIKKALEQTVSSEQFNSDAIKSLAETLDDQDWFQQQQSETIESILLGTLAETTDSESYEGGLSDDSRLSDRTFSYQEEALNTSNVTSRYQIKSILVTGATSQVFLIRDNTFDRDIAAKFLHPRFVEKNKKIKQFLKEARITAKLNHPNILPVHDIDYTEGSLIYFTMAKADGQSLAIAIEKEAKGYDDSGIHDFNQRTRIIQQVLQALSYAHSHDIIHKDIKPSNIMLGPHGEVLVVDWGTASFGQEENRQHLVGTPAYMSPEQARREKADHLSDIYCIGTTFFHLLTLEFPCFHIDLDKFWDMKKKGEHTKIPSQTIKKIPPQLYNIALKAMAADPKDRYQSADEMLQDLADYQHGKSVNAYRENFSELVTRLYKHNTAIFYVLCSCLMVIIVFSIWLYQEQNREYGPWQQTHLHTWSNADLTDLNTDWELGTITELQEPSFLPDRNQSYREPITVVDDAIYLAPKQTSLVDPLHFRHRRLIPGNFQINWQHSITDPQDGISLFFLGNQLNESYRLTIKGRQLTLFKRNIPFDHYTMNFKLLPNNIYPITLEVVRTQISILINNQLIYSVSDPEILTGAKYQRFGFIIDQDSNARISHLNVQRQESPKTSLPINTANKFFANELYDNALLQYRSIQTNYTHSDMVSAALYMEGRCLSQNQQPRMAEHAFGKFLNKYNDSDLFPFAAAEYIISLAQQEKWNDCIRQFKLYRKHFKLNNIRVKLQRALTSEFAKAPQDHHNTVKALLNWAQ